MTWHGAIIRTPRAPQAATRPSRRSRTPAKRTSAMLSATREGGAFYMYVRVVGRRSGNRAWPPSALRSVPVTCATSARQARVKTDVQSNEAVHVEWTAGKESVCVECTNGQARMPDTHWTKAMAVVTESAVIFKCIHFQFFFTCFKVCEVYSVYYAVTLKKKEGYILYPYHTALIKLRLSTSYFRRARGGSYPTASI